MSLNELQRQVRDYDVRFGWTKDVPENAVLHMQEELGEISRNMLKRSGYKKGEYDPKEMNDEITDLLYLTLKLGNLLELDLDEGWLRIQERYSRK
jgi:NTP pyrophosphatase (non-canonical NTP hydrolase)